MAVKECRCAAFNRTAFEIKTQGAPCTPSQTQFLSVRMAHPTSYQI
jgi:hypothetical protein